MPYSIRKALCDSIEQKEKDLKQISEIYDRGTKVLEELCTGTMDETEFNVAFKCCVLNECELIVELDLIARAFTKEEAKQILAEFGGELNEKENSNLR